MFKPSAWHIVVLVIALIVLFGWKSLPNMARSLGQSMRIFKSEVEQMKGPSAASTDTVKGEASDTDAERTGEQDGTDQGRSGSGDQAAHRSASSDLRDDPRDDNRG